MTDGKSRDLIRLQHRLKGIAADIEAKLRLVEQELRHRDGTQSEQALPGILALDFDVIYDYIYPQSDVESRQLAAAAVDGLLRTEPFRVSLLPGTVFEFLQCLFWGVSELVPAVGDLDGLMNRLEDDVAPTFGDLDFTHRLRSEAFRRLQLLEEHRSMVRLALEFLGSNSLTGIEEAGLAASVLAPDPEIARSFYRALEIQRGDREINNRIDSLNLAIVLKAGENGFVLPIITKSPLVHRAYRAVTDQASASYPPNLVWDPRQVVFSLSVRLVGKTELLQFRQDLSSLLLAVRDHGAMPAKTISHFSDSLAAFEEGVRKYLAIAGFLERSARRVADFRQAQLREMPPDVDVHLLGTRLLAMAEASRKEIQRAIGRLSDLAGPAQQAMQGAVDSESEWRPIVEAAELLREFPERPVIIVEHLEKLVYNESGGRMSDYTVIQKGQHLTAIVDSFKLLSADAVGVLGNDAHKMLSTLVESIVGSDLPSEEKESALTGVTQVVETVKEEGRLTPIAKLIWRGLRDTVKFVPDAIRAWEALEELWK